MKRYLLPLLLTVPTIAYADFADDWDFKAEIKANYRDSEAVEFPTGFPFGPGNANNKTIGTVDPGEHFEVSLVSLFLNWQISENWKLITKVDGIDLYDRNPTSSDYKVSLDRAILRYGNRHTQGELPDNTDGYFQVGKFGKFERQEDRHLESYGLAATAFNFLEDSGIEMGVDFASGLYAKVSYTTGNPLFLRDPNALAGDNGAGPDAEYATGIVVLYDAEIETLDLSEHPETGLALGYRWVSDDGGNRINLMAFNYERELAERDEVHGSSWGADLAGLDLSGLVDGVSLPITGNEKSESGVNFWWYGEKSSLFAQYVEQDNAGLERSGWEVEFAHVFSGIDSINLQRIVPVIRYSELNIEHGGHPQFRSPGIFWDWTKTDIGINFEFKGNIKLTLEYADLDFVRGGKTENNNETRITLSWKYD